MLTASKAWKISQVRTHGLASPGNCLILLEAPTEGGGQKKCVQVCTGGEGVRSVSILSVCVCALLGKPICEYINSSAVSVSYLFRYNWNTLRVVDNLKFNSLG